MTDGAQLPSGTKIFIKPGLGNTEVYCSLSGITLNGDIVSDYDAAEDAYFALMPARYSELEISYVKVDISPKGHDTIQCYLGSAVTKVIVGDYAGRKIVGRMTISARHITDDEPMPHGVVTFTTYEERDMDISFYEYNRPNEKMTRLLDEYESGTTKEFGYMIKILFVCHGNICRSPMAEFVLKDMVKKRGLEDMFYIASAATSTEEIGNGVHYGTRNKLAQYGISVKGKTAVQLRRSDYDNYDYIIGMDDWNMRNMLRIVRGDPENKLCKLLDFSGSGRDVADPWYTGDFDVTYDDIIEGCTALLDEILNVNKVKKEDSK